MIKPKFHCICSLQWLTWNFLWESHRSIYLCSQPSMVYQMSFQISPKRFPLNQRQSYSHSSLVFFANPRWCRSRQVWRHRKLETPIKPKQNLIDCTDYLRFGGLVGPKFGEVDLSKGVCMCLFLKLPLKMGKQEDGLCFLGRFVQHGQTVWPAVSI